MLVGLCGNRNVQRILTFLFVNQVCYGAQLHRLFKIPLTPIQKALGRLEKGGVVLSHYQGKTRLYQFNPAYPLLAELEQLLKKMYALLPSQEKRQYYVAEQEHALTGAEGEKNGRILVQCWEKLKSIKQLAFQSTTKAKEETGWAGKGTGEVVVCKEGQEMLIFHEKGKWHSRQGEEMDFSNVFRWTLDRSRGVIALEHLRRGANHPVFLLHLVPVAPNTLSSVDSHLCAEDAYFGRILFDEKYLRLCWRVIGPKKNEEIDYYYS